VTLGVKETLTVLTSLDNVLLAETTNEAERDAVPFSADCDAVGVSTSDLVTVMEATSRDAVPLYVVEYVDELLSDSVSVWVGETSSEMVADFVGSRVAVGLGDLDRVAFVFSHDELIELLVDAVWLAFGVPDAE
jgi:hypothetical protein